MQKSDTPCKMHLSLTHLVFCPFALAISRVQEGKVHSSLLVLVGSREEGSWRTTLYHGVRTADEAAGRTKAPEPTCVPQRK